jgi:hypothetical protein
LRACCGVLVRHLLRLRRMFRESHSRGEINHTLLERIRFLVLSTEEESPIFRFSAALSRRALVVPWGGLGFQQWNGESRKTCIGSISDVRGAGCVTADRDPQCHCRVFLMRFLMWNLMRIRIQLCDREINIGAPAPALTPAAVSFGRRHRWMLLVWLRLARFLPGTECGNLTGTVGPCGRSASDDLCCVTLPSEQLVLVGQENGLQRALQGGWPYGDGRHVQNGAGNAHDTVLPASVGRETSPQREKQSPNRRVRLEVERNGDWD